MNLLEEIKNSKKKPKELVAYLTEEIKKDKTLFGQLIEGLTGGSDVERGTCADLLKHVTKDRPEYALPYLEAIIAHITYKAPRVKWGTQEAIANISPKFPQKVELAIPSLLVNTRDQSTVVRWCAAYALTEIAKSNPKTRNTLVPKFRDFVEKEKNSGVRNVYLKVFKVINK